jgi:hypothetical protein
MDIKTFALQDWVKRDLLCLQRINTGDNYADAMTKSLGLPRMYYFPPPLVVTFYIPFRRISHKR